MSEDLEKIFMLIEKTGDRFIVKDKNHSYVIMKLDEYEKLLEGDCTQKKNVISEPQKEELSSLSEEEMLKNIHEQISSWQKNSGQENNLVNFN